MFKLDKQAKTLTIGEKVYNEQDITLNCTDGTTKNMKAYDLDINIEGVESVVIASLTTEIENHIKFIGLLETAMLLDNKSKVIPPLGEVISTKGNEMSKKLDKMIDVILTRNNIDATLFENCDMAIDYKINKIYVMGGNE